MDEHNAATWFIDGVWRPVYDGAEGRQYVTDGDGARAYGVWHYPRGEPTPNVIVNAPANGGAGGDFPCRRFPTRLR